MTYRVNFTEYESGWGSRPEGHEDFATLEEATKRQKEYNDKYNNKPTVPSWYIKAETPVKV